MAVETAHDRNGFINPNEFGLVVHRPGSSSFSALFDEEHLELEIGGNAISSRQPELIAQDADITGLAQGSPLVINGQPYTVTDIQPDGTGMSVIKLVRQ